jgi:DNA-binding beta-propeller fold protein YncE
MRLLVVVTVGCLAMVLVPLTTAELGMEAPRGMAFDRSGNLFVSRDDSIFKFTPDGIRSTFASGLKSPFGLAFDKDGNLFAADKGAGAILKFTPDGSKSTFATGITPAGLAFDNAGNLFVADLDDGRGSIVKFAPDGGKSVFARSGLAADGLIGPAGPAIGKAGDVFTSDIGSGYPTILKFGADGKRSSFASGFGTIFVLVCDAAGNLYVSSEEAEITGVHTRILKFAPDGSKSVFVTGLEPVGLVFDKSGNLFAFDARSRSILKFTPDGTKSTFASDVSSTSPDKKWEFVGGEEPRILDAATKQVVLENFDGRGGPVWAPDSKRFGFNYHYGGRRGYIFRSVAFYELRGDKWEELGSPTDNMSGSQLVQLLKEHRPKKFNPSDCSSNSDVLELRDWTDASTATLYAPCYRSNSEKVKAGFLFTLKFDAAGKWNIVKTHQMSEKEIEKIEKGE